MFGYQNLANWGFDHLEPHSYNYDFQAMIQFLDPNGPLFKLIDRLLTDQDAVFQLPFEILPVCNNLNFESANTTFTKNSSQDCDRKDQK